MEKLYKDFREKIEFIDKFLLLLIISIPFFLATSIFLADLMSSIASIILIYIFFKEKNYFFKKIKTEIIFVVTFYLIILTSLFFTEYFKNSFLASFFYFRYLLLSLSIYYLLKKYDFFIKIILYSLIFTMLIVLVDALIQNFYGSNLFGYDWPGRHDGPTMKIITGFFNEEKKLGSYLVRFLPLVLAAIFWLRKTDGNFLANGLILFVGSVIFLTSERTALLLYFIIIILYLPVCRNKIKLILFLILSFTFLFTTHTELRTKFTKFTIDQIRDNHYAGEGHFLNNKPDINNGKKSIYFYSAEHENFAYTSIKIFEENFLFGSGVKTFYQECNNLKKNKLKELVQNKRGNKLQCSTHPHSTYFQILSDTGIFGFILCLYVLYYVILVYCKLFIKICKKNKINISYYFVNIGVLISIFPLIPSGNIFNNWISLILFYTIGFWLFFKENIILKEDSNSNKKL